MKKVTYFSLFLICSLVFNMQAQVTVPEEGTIYNIKHVASARYLTRSLGSDPPVIQTADLSANQKFQFKPVAGVDDTYQIMCVGTDEYLSRLDAGNSWTMNWVADPNSASSWPSSTISDKTQNAQWKIVAGDGYVLFLGVAGNGYVGTDATSDGAVTYANKSATEERSQWIISVATGTVDKEPLQIAYDEAKALYDNTSEGTGSNQYPADKRAALADELDYSLEILEDAGASQADVNDALSTLSTALSEYRASVYPFQPSTTEPYYIQHSSGFYSTGNTIAAATYAADQQFTFASVGNDYYNIKNSAGEYLTRSSDNGYSLSWGTDGTIAQTQYIIKSTGTGYYTIRCIGLGGEKTEEYSFMGTDANTAGSGVYIDKNGKDGKHYWKIVPVGDVGLVTTALEAAVAKVEEFLQYAIRGEGADQYPATEYDALTAAKTAAVDAISNATTQTQVSDATIALNNALAACIAAVKPLAPNTSEVYNIIHYGGYYLNAVDFSAYEEGASKANALTITGKSETDNQKITFAAVEDTIYQIKIASVADSLLTRCTDPASDDYKLIWSGDATSPYTQFVIKRVGVQDYYTIKCTTAGPTRSASYLGTDDANNNTGVYIDKSGTSTNHYWRIVKAGEGEGIKSTLKTNLAVCSGNGVLQVAHLEGKNKISVYSLTGQLIFTQTGVTGQFTKSLPQGMYVIVVDGATQFRGKAVVR